MARTRNVASRWFGRNAHSRVAVALLLLAPSLSVDRWLETDQSAARATFDSYYERWLDLTKDSDALSEDQLSAQLATLIDGLFYLDGLAPRIIPDAWPTLTPHEQGAFIEALKLSIESKVLSYARRDGKARLPSLELASDEAGDSAATLEYSIKSDGAGTGTLTVHMVRTPADRWKVSDVEYGEESLLGYYQGLSSKLLKDYSLPYLIAKLGDYPSVILEDFESSPVGELPLRWSWKKTDDEKHKPYAVRREDGNNYLEATDEGESVILGKDVKWNLEEYPYVSFRWRVHEIPEGADERFDNKVDSAAGIYFVYKKVLGLIPESVKYVWSSTLPVGAAVRREGVGKPWMIVAETGKDHLGEWRTYVFNLQDAYRETFGRRPPKKLIGIGILSDANSMKSHAYADYDDIRALKSADATVTSGVSQILKANEQ